MLPKAYLKYKNVEWTPTVMAGEHCVQMPDLPSDPTEVYFINDSPENAYWNRDRILKDYKPIWFKFIPNETLVVKSDEIEEEGEEQQTVFDEDGYAVSLNKKDSDYIRYCYEREMERRLNGVYIKIGNKLEWITGDHWFTMMWCKTKRPDKKGDYFDYREYQRDFFYQIKHTWTVSRTDEKGNAVPLAAGFDWSKAKKTGITNLMWCYYLNKATMTKNINLGMMSIDKEKAAKTFRDHFMYAYNGLALALKPDIKSKSEAEGIIVFGKRYNSKQSKRNTDDDELNTTVMCVATALNAFDVDVFSDVWYDENPKYKTDFGAIFRSNGGATKIQDLPIGRQWLTSYTPEQSGVSFIEAKKIFFNSELKTINEFSEGRTKSGLLCDHIPAYKSWATSFDKFGKCNEKEAMQKITSELNALVDRPHEYLKKRREHANTKKDAWSVADSSSLFDPIRLAELAQDLEELQRSQEVFTNGELQWVNPLLEVGKKDKRPKGVFDRVRFVPVNDAEKAKGLTGKLRMYEPLLPQEENTALLYGKDDYGNLMPPPRFKHVGGIDPADFRDVGNAEDGSLIGMYAMSVHNTELNTMLRRPATKIITCEYLERPDNPEEWYQDIVKHIIYFGCLIIIEANNGTIATRLEDEGLGHYMLFKNEEGIIVEYLANHKNLVGKARKHIKNVKAGSVDTTADIIAYIKSYLLKGQEVYGEIDYGMTIKSERLIKQLQEFEADNTKKYDLVMAFGYVLMAHENYIALLNKPVKNEYKPEEINVVMRALQRIH